MQAIERRERDREAMRRTILAAARELFLKEGYQNASIRKIADRIGYSAPAIYRYFSGKEDIFFALAEVGFRLFHRAVSAVEPADDPLETVRRRFWRYYEFSKAQPEYFALMFVDRTVPRISREWERIAFMRTTRGELRELIGRCIQSGAFPAGTSPDVVFHVLATVVHGAAVIRLSDRFVPREAADALARDTMEAALSGLRHGLTPTFDAQACFHSASEAPPVCVPARGPEPVKGRRRQAAGVAKPSRRHRIVPGA